MEPFVYRVDVTLPKVEVGPEYIKDITVEESVHKAEHVWVEISSRTRPGAIYGYISAENAEELATAILFALSKTRERWAEENV